MMPQNVHLPPESLAAPNSILPFGSVDLYDFGVLAVHSGRDVGGDGVLGHAPHSTPRTVLPKLSDLQRENLLRRRHRRACLYANPGIREQPNWFSVHLTRFSTEVDSSSSDVRFGSLADINRTRRLCPLSGVKRT